MTYPQRHTHQTSSASSGVNVSWCGFYVCVQCVACACLRVCAYTCLCMCALECVCVCVCVRTSRVCDVRVFVRLRVLCIGVYMLVCEWVCVAFVFV